MRKRKVRVQTNCDRLKVCCTSHTDYLYKELLSINSEDTDITHIVGKPIPFNGGHIEVKDAEISTKGESEPVIKIEAELHVNGISYRYATITTDRNYLWLTISNRVFYDPLTTTVEGEKISLLAILPNILETLHLEIHSVTWCDICVDSNVNIRKFLLKALKDDSLVPIVNGVAYTNADKRKPIQGYLKIYEGSRTGQVGKPSLYFKNYDDSIVVTCYNKGKEITDGGKRGEPKDYIRDYNGWQGKMHRLEVRAKSAPIKSFCNEAKMTYLQFLSNLCDESFRYRLFDYLATKIIYYNTVEAFEKHKCDRRTLLSVVMGAMADISEGCADNFGG